MTRRAIYGVTGMTCLSCAQSAEEALKNVRGVREAKVYFAGKAAEIEFDPEATDFERLRQALVPLGYTLVADRRQIAVEHRRFMSRLGYKVVLAVALTVPLWVAHMLGKELPGAPWVALALNGWVAFYCGWGFFASAYEQLKRRSPGMDVLVALGAGAAWVYDLSFALTGRQGHLESAAVIVAFVLTGKWIEEWAKAQADDPRERLSVLQVETARKIDDAGRENLISVAELEPGMRARVLPGERFPADGRLLEGETYADESMLTGEFEPTFKKRHDTVWGGTLNLSQPVVIQVEAKYAESAVEKIIREVETAESVRAPMQRWMDVLAARFVPGVAALSVAAFIGTYFWGEGGWTGALRTMLTVMVASCPCALGLAAPVAIKVAAGAAARRGLVIRNAAAFETLVAADVVAFDKTGTLTYGKPQVVSVEWNEKLSHAFGANASRLAGALNQSSHPLSKALLSFLEGVTRRSTPPLAFDEHPGKGFQAAFDDGAVVTVGNARWMRENRINTPLEDDRKIYAAVNTEIWAAFVVQDAIKAEAAQTVQTFKTWGVETVLLTGDHVENTQPVAEAVGIDRFEARLLPAQKAERIRQMQANGKVVVMVGDGVNDAPAFATANVGAAMGNGSQLAVRHADIVVMGGDLRKLVFLFRLARKTRRIVLQNVVWALGYNVVVLPTALGIFHPVHLSPGAAGGLMALSSLVVVLNGLRIKFFKA